MKRMSLKRRPSLAKLQQAVAVFNEAFPVGSKVKLRTDSGEVQTTVVAPAEVLGEHSAVGWFDGIRGCYSIEGRVTALN